MDTAAYPCSVVFCGAIDMVIQIDYISDRISANPGRECGSMISVADKTMKRISAHANDRWVCTPTDFLDIGSRAAVDQALSRLVKAGRLRRIGRGLYDVPRRYSISIPGMSDALKNGYVPADLEATVAAVARRDGIRIMLDGLVAANRLGVTNAIPAKVCYVTDGRSRTLRIDGRNILFQHAGPRVMRWLGKPGVVVSQALRWLGPYAIRDPRVEPTLIRTLPDDVKMDLLQNIGHLPVWARPLVRRITSKQAVSK